MYMNWLLTFNLIKEYSIAGFRSRDQSYVLGFLWSFLNPLLMTSILFFLFKSRIGRPLGQNYFLYVLIGNVIWNFFSTSTYVGLTALVRKPDIVKNVAFPKETLIAGDIGTMLIQHIFELLVVFAVIALSGIGFSPLLVLLLPFILCIEIFLILSIALFMSCLIIYVRDLEYIWHVVIRMGFFVVPVFYNVSSISPTYRWIVALNPMTQLMTFYRDILLDQRLPDLSNLALVALFNTLIFVAGYLFFKSHEHKIVENV